MGELVDPLRYDNAHDVEMRLQSTIIRYKGEPVLVRLAHPDKDPFNGLGIQIRRLTSNNKWSDYIHSSDSDLDISSVPLGYLNLPYYTSYITRIPYRKQKQGVAQDNVTWWPEVHPSFQDTSLWSALLTKGFNNTVLNLYPSGGEALYTLQKNDKIHSLAFHRKFALVRDEAGLLKLKHMTKAVGWITPSTNKCFLPEENYNPIFEEELTELGLPCGVG